MMATFGALPLFLLSAQSVAIGREFGFGPVDLGAATGTFFLVAALSTIALAPVIDRLPLRVLALAAGLLGAGAGLGVALGARGATSLIVFLGLAGMGNAALQITANLSMARSIAPGRQGLAYGIKQSANPLAALMAGLLATVAIQVGGWRASYVAAAAASLLVVLSHLRPRTSRMVDEALANPDRPPRRALVVGGFATALASSSAVSVAAFLPGWTHRLGMSSTSTGMLVAVVGAASVASRLLVGGLADRRDGGHLRFVGWLLLLGALGYLLLAVPVIGVTVVGALMAFTLGWGWPGLLVFAFIELGRDVPGAASSAIQAGAFAGGAAGPPLFGVVVESVGWSSAWITAAGTACVAAALVAWARRIFDADAVRRTPASHLQP